MRPVFLLAIAMLVPMDTLSNVAATGAQEAAPYPAVAAFTRVYIAGTAGVVAPVVAKDSPFIYTPQALRARIKGFVSLEITVGADGHVRDAVVTKSLDVGLDAQAVAAIGRYVFVAGTVDNRPAAVRMPYILEAKIH